jgi:hypothetical protein
MICGFLAERNESDSRTHDELELKRQNALNVVKAV